MYNLWNIYILIRSIFHLWSKIYKQRDGGAKRMSWCAFSKKETGYERDVYSGVDSNINKLHQKLYVSNLV